MLMVVFGAGASYDSYATHQPLLKKSIPRTNVDEYRLPLAAELFDDRSLFANALKELPECHAIIPLLREVQRNMTVEQVLEELRKEAKENNRRFVQLAAIRHYLQLIITRCGKEWENIHGGITNVLTLLDEIEPWRIKTKQEVCLVTFNYDTLIENALPEVGVRIENFKHYISEPYKLFKLHGSVNWAREVEVPFIMKNMSDWDIARRLIRDVPYITPSNTFKMVTTSPIGRSDGYPLVPALAIPIVEKQDYECPPQHLEVLDACLPNVSKLIVIGWRANEKHFLKKLSKCVSRPIRGLVVSGDTNGVEECIKNLSSARLTVPGDYTRFEKGFSGLITMRAVREFLELPDLR